MSPSDCEPAPHRTGGCRRFLFCLLLCLCAASTGVLRGQPICVIHDSIEAMLSRGEYLAAQAQVSAMHSRIAKDSSLVSPCFIDILRFDVSLRYHHDSEEQAFLLANRMLDLARTMIGPRHPSTLRGQLQLAGFLHLEGRISDAGFQYRQVLETLAQATGITDSLRRLLLLEARYGYGQSHLHLGHWKEAETWLLLALEDAEETLPRGNGAFLETLFALVDLYKEQGMLPMAERYALRAVETCRDVGCFRLYWYQTYLAEVKQAQGRFAEAEQDFREALADVERKYGLHDVEITTTLNDLGVLYQTLGRFAEAEPLLRRALTIRQTVRGAPSVELARSLLNLGTLYMAMGRYVESEPLLREGLAMRQQHLGPGHYLTARAMNNLGRLLYFRKQYTEAEEQFLGAHAAAAAALPTGHPAVARYADHLALLYATSNRWRDAEPYWRSARDQFILNIMQNFPTLSAKEKAQYFELIRPNFERYYTWYLRGLPDNPGLTREMYDNRVAEKSLLLRSSRDFRRTLEATEDSTLHDWYVSWLRLEGELGNAAAHRSGTDDEQQRALDSLTTALNAIEHQLALQASGTNALLPLKTHGWRDVQKRLGRDEAVVEIIRFRHFETAWTDSICYLALIITPRTRDHPELVLLPDGNALETTWHARYLSAMLPRATENSRLSMREYRATLPERLRELYRAYWAPIQQRLDGVRRVYLSDDGVYQLVNINTLMTPSGRFVVEELEIRRLTNSMTLASEAPIRRAPLSRQALILARPDFQGNSDHGGAGKSPSLDRPGTPLPAGMEWRDLRYTEEEGNAIHQRLTGSGWTAALYLGDQAKESWLRAYPPPTLIHLATHGFFLPDTTADADVFMTGRDLRASEDPLLRSGLVFAGAGKSADPPPPADASDSVRMQDDGILFSKEASTLRLDGTELVVLSACETAAGTLYNGQGVFGLQRAFLIAGAQAVMMSLWSIDDHAAYTFMTTFYAEYMRELDAESALRATQRARIADGALPCDWGAFTILRR